MVDETIYFEDSAGETLPVTKDTVFQALHRIGVLAGCRMYPAARNGDKDIELQPDSQPLSPFFIVAGRFSKPRRREERACGKRWRAKRRRMKKKPGGKDEKR